MQTGAKPAMQARSRQKRDKILASLRALLIDRDFSTISVADIAGHAGVSVGTIYRRFENRDALLPLLLEQIKTEAEGMSAQEFKVTDLDMALSLMVHSAWDQLSAEPYLFRALYLEVRQRPELVLEGWEELEEASIGQITALLSPFLTSIPESAQKHIIQMVSAITGSAFIERILFPDVAPDWIKSMNREEMTRELVRMVHAYINSYQT